MLVLTRKQNESVQIDSAIQVTVVSIRKGRVKLGFSAPEHVRIVRTELVNGGSGVAVTEEGTRSQKAK